MTRRTLENALAMLACLAFSLGFWWLVWTWIASGLPDPPRSQADEPDWDAYVAECGPHGTEAGSAHCDRWEGPR